MSEQKKKSTGSNRTESARKAAAKRAARKEEQRRKKEVRGVVCIAAGILLGIYMFFSGTGLLGEMLSKLPFGLFGITAYVIPVLFLFSGIMIIRNSRNGEIYDGPDWVFYAGIWDIITLAHAFVINDKGTLDQVKYTGVDFFAFISNAYRYSVNTHKGGGALGSILCYPLLQFGGKVLAIIVPIAFLIVCVLLVTRFSLRDMSEKVARKLQAAPEEEPKGVRLSEPGTVHKKKIAIFKSDDPYDEYEEYDSSFSRKRKKEPRTSDLAGFDAALNALSTNPAAPGTVRKPPASELSTLNELNDFSPALKQQFGKDKTAKPSTGKPPSGKRVAVNSDPHPYTGRQKTSDKNAPEPLPFGSSKDNYEVPVFLAGEKSDKPPKSVSPQRKTGSAGKKKPVDDDASKIVPKNSSVPAGVYNPPPYDLLHPAASGTTQGHENPMESAKILVDTLASFNIAVKILDYSVGPVITRFELQPAPGVRVSRIIGLSNDIALALAAPRVRIEAPIPGKAAVGIEIPNKSTIPVVLREIVESKEFHRAASPITLAFGKDIAGKVITYDLAKMPHLLIAGSTGSGKSVCINDLIISMIYKSSPADLRMILIDPKVVELSPFSTLPHLLIPVVTEPKKAASALRWAVNEMMSRYEKFPDVGARDLQRYNALQKNPENRLPKLVVIIDELADLMMVAPNEVEDSICRIAQLGRAAGIHLIVATQRPSADIITGLIKANIPSRCAFAVSSGIDSRIILDAMGAEKLLGRGDMLFHPNGADKPMRIQCAFVSDEEVENIVNYFKEESQVPSFDDAFVTEVTTTVSSEKDKNGNAHGEGKQEDELLPDAVGIVLESGSASISMIQRRLRVGYARAARLIDIMEQLGYVSGFEGSKPRKLLITKAQYEEIFYGGSHSGSDAEDSPDGEDEDPFESEDYET